MRIPDPRRVPASGSPSKPDLGRRPDLRLRSQVRRTNPVRIRCGWSPTGMRAISFRFGTRSPRRVVAAERDEAVPAVARCWSTSTASSPTGPQLVAEASRGPRSPRSRTSCPATHSFVPSGFIASPWWAESSRYSSRGVRRLVAQRQVGHAAVTLSLLEVVLDEAVEERDLEVEPALVRATAPSAARRSSCPDRRTRPASGPCRSARAPRRCCASTISKTRSPLVASSCGLVERRVDRADARVVDPLAVLGVVVLVRLVAGREAADDLARSAVSIMSTRSPVDADTAAACRRARSPCGRRGSRPPACARRSCRVAQVDRDDVREARPRTYRQRPSCEVNMSSTNWSWPSPTSWRIARK